MRRHYSTRNGYSGDTILWARMNITDGGDASSLTLLKCALFVTLEFNNNYVTGSTAANPKPISSQS